MIDFSKFKSLLSVSAYFHSDEVCKEVMAELRWGQIDGSLDVVCPFCGKHHCCKRRNGRFQCNHCRKSFSVTAGTIFHATKLPLTKWFLAMYLISSHKKGISSCQVARDIEISQTSAWFMMQKIRTLFGFEDAVILNGEVEMDEMYLGGREANKHESKKTPHNQGRSTKTKAPIFGMANRNGLVVIKHVVDTKAATLMPIVKEYVKKNSWVFTDELVSYNGLRKNGYNHEVVFHHNKQYVNGRATTNSIEGFWGHFKRVVFGTYHFVSKEYLQRYIDEQVFRWNTRKWSEDERFKAMFLRSMGHKTCREVRVAA